MNYKEKYEQAIENIKKIKAANKDNKELIDFIEYQYPELKESEDEKIRKDIIWCIKHSGIKESNPINPHVTTTVKDAIAWLKKQSTQKSVNNQFTPEQADTLNKHIDEFIKSANWSKEDENEEIIKWLINEIKIKHHNLNDDNVDFVDKAITWLEKQFKHKKFLETIKIGDELTKNERGQLVNLSQLKRVAKPRNIK